VTDTFAYEFAGPGTDLVGAAVIAAEAHLEREIEACMWTVHYAANAGEFGALFMLAEAGRTIQAHLAALEPARDGDSPELTATLRRIRLDHILARRPWGLRSNWDVDTLNRACTTAMRITRGKDR